MERDVSSMHACLNRKSWHQTRSYWVTSKCEMFAGMHRSWLPHSIVHESSSSMLLNISVHDEYASSTKPILHKEHPIHKSHISNHFIRMTTESGQRMFRKAKHTCAMNCDSCMILAENTVSRVINKCATHPASYMATCYWEFVRMFRSWASHTFSVSASAFFPRGW